MSPDTTNEEPTDTALESPARHSAGNNRHSDVHNGKWWKQPEHIIQIAILIFVGAYTVLTFCLLLTSKDTERKQLRAYVGVGNSLKIRCDSCDDPTKPISVDRGFRDANSITMEIQNFGQTPAVDFQTRTSWKQMPFGSELSADFKYPNTPLGPTTLPMSKSNINPGQKVTAGNVLDADVVDLIKKARHHDISLYYYGHLDYRDIFDNVTTVEFCFRYAPDADEDHHFPLCPDHNSIKEKIGLVSPHG